jgi:hypothetical protein
MMVRLELCDLTYAIKSVFRVQKVRFMTNISLNSVTDEAAK